MFFLTPTASELVHEQGVDKSKVFHFPVDRDTTETVSVNRNGTMLLHEESNRELTEIKGCWMYFVDDLSITLKTLQKRSTRAQRSLSTRIVLRALQAVLIGVGVGMALLGIFSWMFVFDTAFGNWSKVLSFIGVGIGLCGLLAWISCGVLEGRSAWSSELRDSGVLGQFNASADTPEAAFLFCLPSHRDRIAKVFSEESDEVADEVMKRFVVSWLAKWEPMMTEAIERNEALERESERKRLSSLNNSVEKYLQGIDLDGAPSPKPTKRSGFRLGRSS